MKVLLWWYHEIFHQQHSVPVSAVNCGTLTFKNPFLISQQFAALPSPYIFVFESAMHRLKISRAGWKYFEKRQLFPDFPEVHQLCGLQDPCSRKGWLGGGWLVYLTLSPCRSHQARKHVDGVPKTIAHHHRSYSEIHGSVKTIPSTGEMLHTSNKELIWGPVHDKNCSFFSVNTNLTIYTTQQVHLLLLNDLKKIISSDFMILYIDHQW